VVHATQEEEEEEEEAPNQIVAQMWSNEVRGGQWILDIMCVKGVHSSVINYLRCM